MEEKYWQGEEARVERNYPLNIQYVWHSSCHLAGIPGENNCLFILKVIKIFREYIKTENPWRISIW